MERVSLNVLRRVLLRPELVVHDPAAPFRFCSTCKTLYSSLWRSEYEREFRLDVLANCCLHRFDGLVVCAMIHTAKNGERDLLLKLIDRGACRPEDLHHVLKWACRKGHTDTARLLLDLGADTQADNGLALIWASTYGHTDTVKMLLEHEHERGTDAQTYIDEDGQIYIDEDEDEHERGTDALTYIDHALCRASENGHVAVVQTLLVCGADALARGGYPLRAAAYFGHTDLVRSLIENEEVFLRICDLNCALFDASSKGYVDMVRILLDFCGKDLKVLEAQDHASERGHEDILRLLLAAETRVSKRAFLLASRKGYANIVRLFLEVRDTAPPPYIDASDDKEALKEASCLGHFEVVRLLLERGANMYVHDGYFSPLCKASIKGHVDVVRLLLDATKNHPPTNGLCDGSSDALHWASEADHEEIVFLLLAHQSCCSAS